MSTAIRDMDHGDNDIVSQIAEKIRTIRLKRNLSIKQLAEKTSVSKGLLSKIENSKTIPSLPVFVQILVSLDISFKDFFHDITSKNHKDYILIRKDEFSTYSPSRDLNFQYRNIIEEAIPSSIFRISLLNLKPGSNVYADTLPSYRFKHIVTGTCQCHLNNEIVYLKEGDSIYIHADDHHYSVTMTEKEALILLVDVRITGERPSPHN